MLDGGFEVAIGLLLTPTVGLTRTEDDFVAHIAQTVTDPDDTWIFIVNQLNTHPSTGLVELVARLWRWRRISVSKALPGILRSMATRAAFLQDLIIIYKSPRSGGTVWEIRSQSEAQPSAQ